MAKKVNFVLCWHMHQPYYREGLNGDYFLPWVYLHGIKDYDEMAAHLERHPAMHAVVNFAPVLLEQLDDYVVQLEQFLDSDKPMRDPLLNWLSGVEPIPSDHGLRSQIITDCQKAHAPRMIAPYPPYQQLINLSHVDRGKHEWEMLLNYLDEQFFLDLLTWYHLAWFSYWRKQLPPLTQLLAKGRNFDKQDRRQLLELIHQSLSSLIPRYKALAESGQIELSVTPYGHPIVPLLNDFHNMRDTQPNDPAPMADSYPGGSERSLRHLQKGIEVFEHYFGHRPNGIWLSEGAVSRDAIELLDRLNIGWTATGESVWGNSYEQSACELTDIGCRKSLFRPYTLAESQTRLYFRDDGLSDLIGFEYSKWDTEDAISNLIHNLENIAKGLDEEAESHVVSVILDGENAWEYYRDNGYHFINKLYHQLCHHPQLNPTTYAAISEKVHPIQLKRLCAGSWVYGTFSTWIGSDAKNHAWDLLVEAKKAYDSMIKSSKLTAKQKRVAEQQLSICEGSDWFWWFGDYNNAQSVSDFDRLYRKQLKLLYELLQLNPPPSLNIPISQGSQQAEHSGTMRRNR
ncbi:glycoside hydrolase [Ectothiorhodospiraceae bacterium BW-2]|nr:glycoside hydrolase [Ectothiorhodospiraceae bacterium BW-2]